MRIVHYIIFLLICYSVNSQSLTMFNIDTTAFPTIKAKFYTFDNDGKQILNLSPSDLEITENGQARNVTYVSCPEPKPTEALSSVLVMDASGSMGGKHLNLAKEAARAWVEMLPLGKSECAISSFDGSNYLNQDFTTNRNKLHTAINGLQAMGGTDYNAAFINPVAGGLLITKLGKHKRVIVFLTDGQASEPRKDEIIAYAQHYKITIYAVTLGMECPESIKEIATQTSGQWFENLTTNDQVVQIYQQILQIAQGGDPCSIEWESEISCIPGITNVELLITNLAMTTKTSYQSPNSSVAKLEFDPKTVKFLDPEVGIKIDQNVTLTARNADFTITNITSNNASFDITPKSFVLNAGQSIELTVSYIPPDSGYVFARFEIENVLCPKKFYASGGWKGIKPNVRTIKLLHPNGDEVFVVGSDTVITWDGITPEESVKIEYTTNNGANWITVVNPAKNLSYKWRVPKTPSNQCLARVTAGVKTGSFCENPEVEICGDVWMGCNLDVEFYRNGEPIRHARTNAEWFDAGSKKEGAWCYYNDVTENGYIYGKLYNWYAVNDPRGLAPEGWHIPTDEEWTVLESCLGGPSIAGAKLKSAGTLENDDGIWYKPNHGATNESNFSALPGGWRLNTGYFLDLNFYGNWWVATEVDEEKAIRKTLHYNTSYISRYTYEKEVGLSVRCVRD